MAIRLYNDDGSSASKLIRLYDPSDVQEPTPAPIQEPSFGMRNFPGTLEKLADLQVDPFSFKEDSRKVITDYFKGIKESVVSAGEALSEAGGQVKGGTMAGTIGKSLQAGSRILGAVISPISSAFQAAENIPGWGSAAKLINTAFSALGEGTTATSNAVIDKLPIDEKTKENLKPGIAEALSLATQILAGGLVEGAFRVGKPKINELKTKYGEQDAQTIIEQAMEIAKDEYLIKAERDILDRWYESQKPGEQKLLQAPEKQGQIGTPDQLLLEGPKQGVGEGFTFTDKTNKSKLETYKVYTEYEAAKSSYAKNPTPTTLKRFQDAREKLDLVRQTRPSEVEPKMAPTKTIPGKIRLYEEPKAPAVAPLAPKTAPETTITSKPSKAASDINKQIVEQGFKELPDTEISRYSPITKADQLQKAAELLTNDLTGAKDMAMGRKPSGDINTQVIFNAVKNKAIREGDISTLRDLAKSPIAEARSLAAQELGASGFENFPNDPVRAMQDISKTRMEKVKDPVKVKSKIKEEIKKEIKKPTKEDWSSFVDSLVC